MHRSDMVFMMHSVARIKKKTGGPGSKTRHAGAVELGAMRIFWVLRTNLEWERRVRRAMTESKGRFPVAAEALDVAVRTLKKWCDEIDERSKRERRELIERASVGRPWPSTAERE